MKKFALFVKVKAKPGKREQVWRLWEKHVKPHVEESDGIEINCYCYDADHENIICFFELFSDPADFKAANQSKWYAEYQQLVKPLLAAPSEVISANPVWAKGMLI